MFYLFLINYLLAFAENPNSREYSQSLAGRDEIKIAKISQEQWSKGKLCLLKGNNNDYSAGMQNICSYNLPSSTQKKEFQHMIDKYPPFIFDIFYDRLNKTKPVFTVEKFLTSVNDIVSSQSCKVGLANFASRKKQLETQITELNKQLEKLKEDSKNTCVNGPLPQDNLDSVQK